VKRRTLLLKPVDITSVPAGKRRARQLRACLPDRIDQLPQPHVGESGVPLLMAIFVTDRSSPSAVILGLRYGFFIPVASFRVVSVLGRTKHRLPDPRAVENGEQLSSQFPSDCGIRFLVKRLLFNKLGNRRPPIDWGF
jgi:hypothetical protein